MENNLEALDVYPKLIPYTVKQVYFNNNNIPLLNFAKLFFLVKYNKVSEATRH